MAHKSKTSAKSTTKQGSHINASEAKMKGGPSSIRRGNGATTGEELSTETLKQRTGSNSK